MTELRDGSISSRPTLPVPGPASMTVGTTWCAPCCRPVEHSSSNGARSLTAERERGARDCVLHGGIRASQVLTEGDACSLILGHRVKPLHTVVELVEVELNLGTRGE
eukprot:128925-Prymnesium_polylepis.2